jgi:putative endonuclease
MILGKEYYCYVIYSQSVDKYYIGYTEDFEERLKLHNSGYFGGKSYTHKASDWKEFIRIKCRTIEMAIYFESRIKRMKSRKFIEDLKTYPEIIEKLQREYHEKSGINDAPRA